VASLDHSQVAELYIVRAELEGLAARHATDEERTFLREMVQEHSELDDNPSVLKRANGRLHRQIHLASHNCYLVQQLDLVHRSMALMETTSLAAEGRSAKALDEHRTIVVAIENSDEDVAYWRHFAIIFQMPM
jgi:DNA-binding GntR family transcriptional regulator